jgi:TRAP-type C4-dicarboxylate transport system substrate-binding protein
VLAFWKGRINPKSLRAALLRSAHGTCMIAMILFGASIFGYFFTLTQVTQNLVAWVGSLPVPPWVILTIILFGYIVLGSFMDQIAILVLTVPIVLPLIKALGYDPLWFGVIKIVTAEVGMITPPVGLNCFVVARYSGRRRSVPRRVPAFHRAPDCDCDPGDLADDHPLAADEDGLLITTRTRERKLMAIRVDRRLVLAGALAITTTPAAAQEKITLRLAESLPQGHVIHELVAKPFMELVTKATNGQVVFQHYPAEQLGKAKDMAQLTVAGVADISYIVPSYSSDKYPLTAVAELPGIFDTECQGSLAFYKISHNGGILETKEFAPNQLRPLVTLALPAYQIQLATAREVKTGKDLEGLKVRTTGGAMDLMMRAIGGVPVRMAAPEIYESLTRGTLDGVIFSYQSSVSYDFGKLLKSGTEGLNFGTAIFTYSIGENKFKSLPENVRKALVEAGEQTTREGCKRFEDGEKAAAEKIKSQGMKVINFSAEDKKQFDTAFKAVAEDWVKDINKRGKPGTEVFKAFTDALTASH